MTNEQAVNRACFRLLEMPELEPLLRWWELQLLNGQVPPGPVDGLRLAMRQGDGERLLAIKLRAEAHRTAMQGPSE